MNTSLKHVPFWRKCLYALSVIVAVHLAVNDIALWKFYRNIGPRDMPIMDRGLGFVFDWKSASEERHFTK